MPSPRDDENQDDERRPPRRPRPSDGRSSGTGTGERREGPRGGAKRPVSGRGAPRTGGSQDRRPGARRSTGAGRDEQWKQKRDRPARERSGDERSRGGDSREDRGPRPPIKGRRRTFDIDSAPNGRERDRLDRSRGPADGDGDASRDTGGERWVDDGPVRRAASGAVRRGQQGDRNPRGDKPNNQRAYKGKGDPRGRKPTPGRNDKRSQERAAKRAESALEIDRNRLERMLGPAKANRVLSRLGEASDAFSEDRFEEARKILKPLAETVPDEPAIRELYGLALYRLGRWKLAVNELEEFARRTDSTEQHPVLADCLRALGQHARVEELWDELAMASPEAALIAEGRIVFAGSLADQGKLPEAIAVLEAGALGNKPLKYHHLRMRYTLGDLYDRAGEQQSARRHFEMVAANEPDFFDVADRLKQL